MYQEIHRLRGEPFHHFAVTPSKTLKKMFSQQWNIVPTLA